MQPDDMFQREALGDGPASAGRRARIMRWGAGALAALLTVSVIAAFIGILKLHDPSLPQDPAPVTVAAGKTTKLNLAGGADLIIPPGALHNGTRVSATYQGKPAGTWTDIVPTFAPVRLMTDTGESFHSLLTLEFPVPTDKILPGVDPALQFGISTYDPTTNLWVPVDSTYDATHHLVVAQIPHFSWWNPFTWDFGALSRAIAQGFGQFVGVRTGPATCSGGLPSWVGGLTYVSNAANVAVRSCGQSKGDVLDIEMVNNRAYGQILTYGSGVSWGWHEEGSTVSDIARNHLIDHFVRSNQLYLPPLGRASVGIFKPVAGSTTNFHIGPTGLTIGADLAFYVLGQFAVPNIPFDGHCAALSIGNSLSDVSAAALRDDLTGVADCLRDGFLELVKTGALDKVKVNVSKYISTIGMIKAASDVAGKLTLAAGITWRIGDLVSDWIVNLRSPLGNGFLVYANPGPRPPAPPVTPTVTPTPVPPPPVTPVPVKPTPTFTQAPKPPSTYAETAGPGGSGTFTNYTNAGGTLGQRVAAYQTIQVTCRLTGWKAPDGNNWWYKLASSPWQSPTQFYAPADNYYNNGQTSGSLANTPFYDPKVAVC